MPKQVDHASRRRQIADALWRLAERDTLDAVSVRQVAAEAGVSVGMVQHYFTGKDDLLRFALERVGEDLRARLTRKIGALAEPRDPREVVRVVMVERLPMTGRRRLHALATVSWLARAVLRPELTDYVIAGTRELRDYLAETLQAARPAGLGGDADPAVAADGILALTDGLAAQILNGVHTPATAQTVVADHLTRLFGRPPPGPHAS